MHCTRMYTGDEGQTHFEDMEIPLEVVTAAGNMSRRVPLTHAIFRETQPTYDLDWHNAPQRQFILTLTGSVELTCGDGTSRVFGPGSIVFAEDVEGQGHKSRDVDSPRESVFLPVAEKFDILQWRKPG